MESRIIATVVSMPPGPVSTAPLASHNESVGVMCSAPERFTAAAVRADFSRRTELTKKPRELVLTIPAPLAEQCGFK